MKEKIYTIPVNDAYASDKGCPLCALQHNLDADLIEYYLGPALMEPDVRISTNEKGFCGSHWGALLHSKKNRLGLGLTLHTHLEHLAADLQPAFEEATPQAKRGLFKGKSKDFRKKLTALSERIRKREDTCIICERLEFTMDRYLDVIFFQYCHDPSFKQTFDHGPSYCLPHLSQMIGAAARYLNQNQAAVFMENLSRLHRDSWQELCGDVEWYTKKFDYRHEKESWKNSKDALPRAVCKLAGENESDE